MKKQPRNTNPTKTYAKMIAYWPTLYSNRYDAMRRVFSCAEWKNGCPVLEDTFVGRHTSKEIDRKEYLKDIAREKETRYGRDKLPGRLAQIKLRYVKACAKHEFAEKNSLLIATAIEYLGERFSYVPEFSTHSLNQIPLNELTPAWRAALIEYCEAIDSYSMNQARKNPNGYTNDVVERNVVRLEEAKKTAKEALYRLDPSRCAQEQKVFRDNELSALRHAAEKYGFTLTEIKPCQ